MVEDRLIKDLKDHIDKVVMDMMSCGTGIMKMSQSPLGVISIRPHEFYLWPEPESNPDRLPEDPDGDNDEDAPPPHFVGFDQPEGEEDEEDE